MIRKLRVRHRAIFSLLALGLPVGLALALSARREFPANEGVSSVAPHAHVVGAASRRALLNVLGVELRVDIHDAAPGGARVLELAPARDLERPDVLVYWSAAAPNPLPTDDALFLGELAGAQVRRFELPREVRGGFLSFFTPGHRELLGSTEFDR